MSRVAITLKGLLEPVVIDEDWGEVANTIQLAAAAGKEFLVGSIDGEPVAFSTSNIIMIRSADDDESDNLIRA